MSKFWKVTIAGYDPKKKKGITLEMIDVDDLIEKSIILENDYFNQLKENMKKYDEKYGTFPNIVSVLSPSGEDMTNYQFNMLLARTKEGQPAALLLAAIENNQYKLMGIWPPDLANVCKNDTEMVKRLLVLFAEVPQYWETVYLLTML